MNWPRRTFFIMATIVALALVTVGMQAAPAAADAPRQGGCYTLVLEIVGGKGELPEASAPNCDGDSYAAGTVVTLTAQPADGFSVYQWGGTDDDSSTALTNTVTMDGPRKVTIHYVSDEDPNQPSAPADGGGVALGPVQPLVGDESVIGTDQRFQITWTTSLPYRRIAKLIITFPTSSGGCTGWFIGPHTVATAGHCVYNSSYGGWATSITVVPGMDSSATTTEPYGRQTSTSFRSVEGWTNSGLGEYDYGVIILPNDDLGEDVGTWEWRNYTETYLESLTGTITGYPGDKTYGTMWKDSDPIKNVTANNINYQIDTAGGQSGSPIYNDTGDYAVGIHTKGTGSATCDSGDNCGTRINTDVYNNFINWSCDLNASPTLLLPSNGGTVSTTSAFLDWSYGYDFGSTGYDIQIWQGASLVRTLATSGTTSYIYVSGLTNGSYTWRVRAKNGDQLTNGDNTVCAASDWSGYRSFTYSNTPTVKINEVDIGAIDKIELYNPTGSTASIGGLLVTVYQESGAVDATYTVPSGRTIAPYGYVTLYETSGTDTSTTYYMNDSIFWSDYGSDGAVKLSFGATTVDFMRFGSSTVSYPSGQWSGTNPPSNHNVTTARYPNGYDTNSGSNWCLQKPSLGSANTGCLTTAPNETNLVANGTFSSGESSWGFFGPITHYILNGYLIGYPQATAGSAGFYQIQSYYVPDGSKLELTLLIGNGSNFPKKVTVMTRDPSWGNVISCVFDIPALTPVQTYTVRGLTNRGWAGSVVAAYLSPNDGQPALWLDNISLKVRPSITVSGTECIRPYAPPNVNLVANGTFQQGVEVWSWGSGLVRTVSNQVLYAYHQSGTSASAGSLYQLSYQRFPGNKALEMYVDLGNISAVPKTVNVVLHNEDWSDTYNCLFTVPPGTSLQRYTMRAKSSKDWDYVVLAMYVNPADGQPWLTMDNVSVYYRPDMLLPSGTECISPGAPANVNLLANAAFSSGEASWKFFGSVSRTVVSGVLNIYHTTATDSGGFYQIVNERLFAGSPLEASIMLGNTSNVTQVVQLIVRSSTWSEVKSCWFTIPAYAGQTTYTMRTKTSTAWDSMVYTVYIQSKDSKPWVLADNASLKYVPSLIVSGTTCIDPTAEMVAEVEPEPAAGAAPAADADAVVTVDTVERLFSPDDEFDLIEAEDDILERVGEWTEYDSTSASGTGYIFSSGEDDDALTLAFYGAGVEVFYVKHPALGSFVIEIDGEVLATVDSAAFEAEFGALAVVGGLEETEHMLRIIATDGTAAIDAIAVEGYFVTSSSLR